MTCLQCVVAFVWLGLAIPIFSAVNVFGFGLNFEDLANLWNAINIGGNKIRTMNEWDINIFWVLGRRKYWVALCRRHKFTKQECKLALGRGSLLGPRVSRS